MKWIVAVMVLLLLLPLDPLALGGELVLVLYVSGILSFVSSSCLHMLKYCLHPQ